MRRAIRDLLLLAFGLELIVVAPELALALELVAIPIVLVLAWVAVGYLRRIYLRQHEPRSRFFGMLVDVSARKEFMALWFGYLLVARMADAAHLVALPVPSPEVTMPVSGLVIIVLAGSPIAYAWRVWRVRRGSVLAHSPAREAELDREGVTEPAKTV